VVVVIAADADVQNEDDARKDEEERAKRSDQMRKDRAAVRPTHFYLSVINRLICELFADLCLRGFQFILFLFYYENRTRVHRKIITLMTMFCKW